MVKRALTSRCRHCGVRIVLVSDHWLHSFPNWQRYWCSEGNQKFGGRRDTHAEPERQAIGG